MTALEAYPTKTLLENLMKKQMQIGTLPILSILLLASLPGQIFGQSSGGMSGPGGMSGSGMSAPGGMSGPGMGGGGRSGMGMGSDMGSESMEGMEFTVRPSLSYTVDDKPYRATRVRSFHYVFQSFRPKELAYADNGGMDGGYGGMAGSSGDGSAMGGSGMPGKWFYSGGSSGYPGASAGYAGGGGYSSGSSPVTNRLAINIHAYIFDGEKTNDRTRIELMIEQPHGMGMEGMASGGGSPGMTGGGDAYGGMGVGMGMSSGPSQMQPFASLGIVKAKAPANLRQGPGGATPVLSPPETKLVTDIICQTMWKTDVVKALFASKGQGDWANENESILKQLLAEQYDTQLARQEMEAESIKRRLEQLQDELKRRKLAKDRVVEVQLGRLILDAQGLLNNER